MNLDSTSRRKPQRLKERLREAAGRAILDAAGEVLLERGIDAPMEGIAERAGVAVGTLYNHFKDRKALVEALFDHYRSLSAAEVEAAAERHAGLPVRDQLQAMVEALLARKAHFALLVKHSDRFAASRRRGEARARIGRLFGPVLERGRTEGVLAPDPDGLQPLALLGLLHAFFPLAAEDAARFPVERVAALVVRAFLDGAAAPVTTRRSRP